jgi:Heme oxygenase
MPPSVVRATGWAKRRGLHRFQGWHQAPQFVFVLPGPFDGLPRSGNQLFGTLMRTHHVPEAILISLRHYLYMANTETDLTDTSLQQRLKRETTAVHQHLEAQLGLLNHGFDVHRYLRVLEAFYGFYVPVEAAVKRRATAELPLGFPLRARAELIERDLLALG